MCPLASCVNLFNEFATHHMAMAHTLEVDDIGWQTLKTTDDMREGEGKEGAEGEVKIE